MEKLTGPGSDDRDPEPTGSFTSSEDNAITITATGGPDTPFDLTSLMFGRSTLADASFVNVTLTGFLAGGGTTSVTFQGFGSATTMAVSFLNITSLVITATDDAGIDNLVLSRAVPEPSALALAGLGGLGLVGWARRRRSNNA